MTHHQNPLERHMLLLPNFLPWQVMPGSCLDRLKDLPDGSVHAIVTDPPYGFSDHSPDEVIEALQYWIRGKSYVTTKKGFMGNAWDAFPPGPEFWKEAYRVLVPGGFLLSFAGARTHGLMEVAIRLAGFEIRDALKWIYGSGFPKSHNLANEIDKRKHGHGDRGRAIPTASTHLPVGKYAEEKLTSNKVSRYKARSNEAREFEGYGTALKPATEPIIMARKPLEGTLAQNATRYRTGGLNIDGCRVPFGSEEHSVLRTDATEEKTLGRWPANLVISHHPDCEITGYEQVAGYTINQFTEGARPFGNAVGEAYTSTAVPGGRMPVYRCVEGCPAGHLKAQVQKESPEEGKPKKGRQKKDHIVTDLLETGVNACHDPARYFNQIGYAEEDVDPILAQINRDPGFLYCPKANSKEKEAGCNNISPMSGADAVHRKEDSPGTRSPRAGAGRTKKVVHNNHPTVKPVALMAWLVKLVTMSGTDLASPAVVLDPFSGSGTTGIACLKLRSEGYMVRYIGIEMNERFVEIQEARLKYWSQVYLKEGAV